MTDVSDSTEPVPPGGAATLPAEPASAGDSAVEQEAVVDLLAALAYGELSAFQRLAEDATLAPTLSDKAAIAGMAVAEFQHFQRAAGRLEELGVDPDVAMAPFVGPLNAFHSATMPTDWLTGLIKAYVGDGIAADFYREVAAYVDEPTRDLVLDVLRDTGHAAFAVERVRAAVAADPHLAGRLALWARRLVGEAMVQAQRVAVDREALARLLVGGTGDLAEVGQMFARITAKHSTRMASLGLSS